MPATPEQSPAPEGMRVLLVEDNPADRWFFAEILRPRGYVVVACQSGEEALAVIGDDLPALVVLDLVLPGIDGIEVCRRIRALPGGDEPFIVVITGRDDPDALEDVLAAGADDFVKKPVEPSVLWIRLAIAERRIRENAEFHRAEAGLQAATRELEALFANAQDVFFSVDATAGELIQVSPASERVFGHRPEELVGHPDLWRRFLLPPVDGRDPWHYLSEARVGHPTVVEYAVLRKDGVERWMRASVQVHPDPVRDSVRADGIVVDVTVEHDARRELAGRNRELAALYRLAELTLGATSLQEAYTQILDLVSEVMGVQVAAIKHLEPEQNQLVVVAARGVPDVDKGTIEIPVPQALACQALSTLRPMMVPDLKPTREQAIDPLARLGLKSYATFPLIAGGVVLGTLSLGDPGPIQFDRRFEKLGIAIASTVATYVERLTAEEALRESEGRHRALATELREANDELESFAYSVSHDLRAPLRTMQGFAHALIQNYGSQLSDEARDYAQRIIASGRQSERLISDLLAYSRISFERLELKPVELEAVLEVAREQVRADIDESGAQLNVEGPLPTVLGNVTILGQVVTNLIANGIKFVRPGEKPVLQVRAERRNTDVRLWVEDNGIGVPAGQEERIFGVFERLSEGGDRPGTGIGLAIVRRGLRRIGGTCGVEPRPEGGSAFWIQLPQGAPRTRRLWSRRDS